MELRRELRMYGDDVRSLVHPLAGPPATPGPSPTAACVSFHPTFYPRRRHALTDIPHRPVPTIHSQNEDDGVMDTPPRSRPGAASRFGTTDRPATSTGLLHRPTSSSFAVKTAARDVRRWRTTPSRSARPEGPPRRPTRPRSTAASARVRCRRPRSGHGAVFIPREARHGDARGQGEPMGRSPGIREKATDDAEGPVRLQRPPDRS